MSTTQINQNLIQLVVGHGGPVRDPVPAMDKAVSAAGG
jgi:hypothetical protein